jgi:hypothetical protein
MKSIRMIIALLLVLGLSAPAAAGDLHASMAKAAQQPAPPTPAERSPMSKAYFWPGTALFVGGMAVALNGFLNNRNGDFPEFGEATSTNVKMGAAGLTAAFAGGTLLFLGKRKAGRAPSITFGPGRAAVSQRISW